MFRQWQESRVAQNRESKRLKRPSIILLRTGRMDDLFKKCQHASNMHKRFIKLRWKKIHIREGNSKTMVQGDWALGQVENKAIKKAFGRLYTCGIVLRKPIIPASNLVQLNTYHMVCFYRQFHWRLLYWSVSGEKGYWGVWV